MDRKFCDICGNEIIGDYKVANITTDSTYTKFTRNHIRRLGRLD